MLAVVIGCAISLVAVDRSAGTERVAAGTGRRLLVGSQVTKTGSLGVPGLSLSVAPPTTTALITDLVPLAAGAPAAWRALPDGTGAGFDATPSAESRAALVAEGYVDGFHWAWVVDTPTGRRVYTVLLSTWTTDSQAVAEYQGVVAKPGWSPEPSLVGASVGGHQQKPDGSVTVEVDELVVRRGRHVLLAFVRQVSPAAAGVQAELVTLARVVIDRIVALHPELTP